ncbi:MULTISPECIES: hypothetical protein [Bacillus]|uniref:Group-specific protein n=2 Tax=Bacillus TaxID=1386 RepID=A0ABC9R7M1_BACMY|nr:MULTISPECIES: hypothetical protein [Bacillus]EJQ59353.1 hypothetical protein IEW_03196 [Bacillus mycoides]EJQ66383.1 hypothetical protein IEY_02139 [Bacillus mycoides]EJR42689.1 hypothetical protein III_02041 [Bacillus mycoides]EJV65630.1 hypothetical protein IEU_03196 [Bacillus mycoides]MBG9723452.1 hypothetical protein [Bacillus mycoides]
MTAKLRKSDYVIVMAIIIMYSLIGHVLNLDILKVMAIQQNGVSISFVGIAICYITARLLFFAIRKLKNDE